MRGGIRATVQGASWPLVWFTFLFFTFHMFLGLYYRFFMLINININIININQSFKKKTFSPL